MKARHPHRPRVALAASPALFGLILLASIPA
jgi:hypothetical protein